MAWYNTLMIHCFSHKTYSRGENLVVWLKKKQCFATEAPLEYSVATFCNWALWRRKRGKVLQSKRWRKPQLKNFRKLLLWHLILLEQMSGRGRGGEDGKPCAKMSSDLWREDERSFCSWGGGNWPTAEVVLKEFLFCLLIREFEYVFISRN